MDPRRLPPDIQRPEARALLVAYLAVIVDRVRILDAYRLEAPAMSMLDLAVLQLVSTFEIVEGAGTRQQEIVNAISAPRRTVRDGLDRMVQAGMLMRDEEGLYHPTNRTIDVFASVWPDHVKTLARLSDAVRPTR